MLPAKTWPAFLLMALLASYAVDASARTVCTYVSDHEAIPIPIDERESDRTVRNRRIAGLIRRGDKQADKVRLGRAASYYLDVFEPFQHNGFHYGPNRCANPSLYREAADKLKIVAVSYAAKLIADGEYETAGKYDELRGGALYLLLHSNSYDAFMRHSFEYAAKELPKRDVDNFLQGLIDWRLRKLDSATASPSVLINGGYIDDTAPLLDEEMAAFDRLADFQSRLQAHLKPLYPKIADSRLAEEAKWHRELMKHNAEFAQMQKAQYAIDELGQGINRLRDHPNELLRLKARGNERGNSFMLQEKYSLARLYFDVAENDSAKARAGVLAEQDAKKQHAQLKSDAREFIEKMQKTDAEQADFESETDEMAEEFGFDP